MPVATIDGLQVDYIGKGEGTPLSMLAPGGRVEQFVWRRILDSSLPWRIRVWRRS